MALTAAQQTDAYRFFSIAFNAAPGVEYMNQIADAYATGATTKQVVNAFVSKSQFTNVYPTFLTNEAFASNLVENVVGSSAAAAAKTQAKADIVTALNGGLTRGDVIYTIFNNLAAKPAADADWGATAKMMANKVAVAQYYTEVLLGNTTNLATLQSVLSNVTPATDVSTPAAIQAVLGDVFNAQGQTFVLTANADQVPGMNGSAGTISTTGNDVYVATNTTLSSADRIVDAAGNADKLKYSSQAAATHAAFEMKGVETLEVTADAAQPVTFDLSGSEGLTLLKTLNSTGNTTYNQVTSEADIEINNVTNGANVTVSYQDSVVAGTANDVTLKLANNSNVTPVGTITVGRTADANGGVETISAVLSGAAATVTQLDSDISTLNVTGNQNLTIVTALNSTVDTVAAGGFTGALNINLTGNVAAAGEGALSITTGTGNDVIDLLSGNAAGTVAEATDLATVSRNATIATGAGNDTVEAGLGDDNIDLGEGNDTLVLTNDGLTVADLITGGVGTDTIILNTADRITKSEAERVTHVENFNLVGGGTFLTVTDNLVNTADTGMFTVTTSVAGAGDTVDLTNVAFSSTGKFTLVGNTATRDTVIADDATVNAKATLTFGNDTETIAPTNTFQGDTLRIVDGGTFTFDDFVNVSGLDVIELTATSTIAQTYELQLLSTMIDNRDATNLTLGDNVDDLVIKVNRNVPQGSTIIINADQITGTQRVTVFANSNVVVNVTGLGAARVFVQSSLEFTENADNLIGDGTDNLFTADSLDQLDTADNADGAGGAGDVLQLNFATNNAAATLNNQFNNAAIANIEVLTFETTNVVRFDDGAGTYTFNTVNLSSTAADVVQGSDNVARTYNGLGGADNITAGDVGVGGTLRAALTAGDTLNGGAGNDTLVGGTGRDVISGGDDNDTITNAGSSVLTAGGNDTLDGGAGNDSILEGTGASSITGGTGNDTITAGNGADTIIGGTGVDIINITETVSAVDTLRFATGDSVSTNWVKNTASTWDVVTGFDVAGPDVLDFVANPVNVVVPFVANTAGTNGLVNAVDGSNQIGSHVIAAGLITFFSDDAWTSGQAIDSQSDLMLAFRYVLNNVTQNEAVFFDARYRDVNGDNVINAADDVTFVVVNEADGTQTAVELVGNLAVVAGNIA